VARRATFSNRRLLQPSCHIELTVAERFLTGDVPLRTTSESRRRCGLPSTRAARTSFACPSFGHIERATDYLSASIKGRREAERRVLTRSDLYDAIMERAVERVRPIRRPIIIVAPLVIIVGIILGYPFFHARCCYAC
jgi:hypothetical protein